jgi:hypothetical protein
MRVFSWERTQPSKLSEPVRIRLLAPVGDWCSGSTPDFDSVSISSILISPAKNINKINDLAQCIERLTRNAFSGIIFYIQ